MWVGFVACVVALVALDLRLSRRSHEAPSPGRAAAWSLGWIGLSIAFGLGVWLVRGAGDGEDFFTGYLLEKSLSVDNLLVFLLIFQRLEVPEGERHRVLSWGILGALVLRALLIFAGIGALHAWHPVVYVFGAVLLFTAFRTVRAGDRERDDGRDRLLALVRRVLPLAPRYEGGKFFTREGGRRVGTMLLLVLVVIELSDVLFAIDSVPAVLSVTDDAFIVFSSNVLAILGLRALFFVIVQAIERLRYLRYGLAAILALVAAKMLLSGVLKVPPLVALATTLGVLAVTVVASLVRRR
jgi:TerC family integral membrane protein